MVITRDVAVVDHLQNCFVEWYCKAYSCSVMIVGNGAAEPVAERSSHFGDLQRQPDGVFDERTENVDVQSIS